jgi:hypothetical protein
LFGSNNLFRFSPDLFIPQALLDDEEFAMMIDAHTKFQPQWDRLLMDNWNELDDELAIITTYPQGFVVRSDPVPKVNIF